MDERTLRGEDALETVTCKSCLWSIGTIRGTYCQRFKKLTGRRCEYFIYEPGTDEKESSVEDQIHTNKPS